MNVEVLSPIASSEHIIGLLLDKLSPLVCSKAASNSCGDPQFLTLYLAIATRYYSGTPLLWTPWGPSKVSSKCIERCPHFRGKFILREHIWDVAKCPQYRGVLLEGFHCIS